MRVSITSFAAAAVFGAVTIAAPLPASASTTNGPCATTSGVTVVVDATTFDGGSVTRRCVTDPVSTAYQALDAAGVHPEHGVGHGQSGPYDYLCRIEARPAVADDPCTGFVANKPYWAFWVPDADDANWSYADEGVDTYSPLDGDTLGFSFGVGDSSDPNAMSLSLSQAKDPQWNGS